MTLVKDVMHTPPVHLTGDDSVAKAVKLMTENGIGFLIVVDSHDSKRLTGVLSDTDCVRKILYQRLNPEEKKVSEIMATNVMTTTPDTNLVDAVEVLREHNMKRLPVLTDGVVAGVVSISDVLRIFVEYKKKLLDMALEF